MNKSMKKWMTVLGIPAVMGLTAFGVLAHRVHGFHGGGHGFLNPERIQQMVDWKLNDILDSMDATDGQRSRIMDIKERLVADFIQMHAGMQETHGSLLSQWNSETPDMGEINAAIDDAAAAKTAFAKRVADSIVELHGILTPAQRAMVSDHIEEHHRMVHDALKNR